MKTFFGDHILLGSETAHTLYAAVRDLPIIDYHCHLNEKDIRDDRTFSSLGELWLSGDHYKWRAMRMCGVDEYYVTGKAPYNEKFRKYAEIFPRLGGNPLYYWTQLELALLFDIHEPLGPDTANSILSRANKQLASLRVSDILKRFKVEYIATTDDPVSRLDAHGTYGDTRIAPTFRPDRITSLNEIALSELSTAAGISVNALDGLKQALVSRLDYFRAHGCRISDHGMDYLPMPDPGEIYAAELYARRAELTPSEQRMLSSHLLYFLATEYTRRDMVMQLHFATFRNVNSTAFASVGRDAGYDIMRGTLDTDALVRFLDTLHNRASLPKTVLYTLNPTCLPALATLSGAFPRVLVGAAWWFNDTLLGIRHQLETVAEYAVLGTNLGMLTDSRSFASYARFDFFRRILADFLGAYVDRGELALPHAEQMMQDICYRNVRDFLGFNG